MPVKTIEEFRAFYDTDLRPTLDELEARRLKILRSFFWTLGVVVLVVGVASVIGFATRAGLAVPIVAAILGLIALAIAWWLLTRKYVPEFKTRVVGEIARFIDPSLNYSPEGHIGRDQFSASRIFLTGIDRYRGEDHIAGRIGSTAIEFSEVHAEYKTTSRDSKGHTQTHWHTIFKGLFVIADFNKNFQGTTVVLPDVAEKTFGWFGKLLQKINITRREKLVKLEDPEFEKAFVVYGTDQVEARYILSPALMRRILDFNNRQRRPVCMSFTGSNVHIAVTTDKNMFEPHLFKRATDFALVSDYLTDLQFAVGIVDDLDLNTRIWTKE